MVYSGDHHHHHLRFTHTRTHTRRIPAPPNTRTQVANRERRGVGGCELEERYTTFSTEILTLLGLTRRIEVQHQNNVGLYRVLRCSVIRSGTKQLYICVTRKQRKLLGWLQDYLARTSSDIPPARAKPTGWGRGGRMKLLNTPNWILGSPACQKEKSGSFLYASRWDPNNVESITRFTWNTSFHHVLEKEKSTSTMFFFLLLKSLIGRWTGLDIPKRPLLLTPDLDPDLRNVVSIQIRT